VIVVAGEALVDLVIRPDGAVTATLGGAPFNTARAIGRLGGEVSFVGALSTDRFGGLLTARLVEDHVDLSHAVRVDEPTTLAAAEIDERGAASYRFYLAGTSAPLLDRIEPLGPAGAGQAVTAWFTGGLGLVLEPMAGTIVTALGRLPAEVVVMVDVNCRPRVITDRTAYLDRVAAALARSDVVKVSDEDLGFLDPDRSPLDAATQLLDRGPTVVLLTRGGDGVTVLGRAGRRDVAVEPVEVVDTIGAGDAFGGGFLAWWNATGRSVAELADLDLVAEAVHAANRVAAVVCGRRGADPPWRAELPADWDRPTPSSGDGRGATQTR
jgi:fructokinase